MRITNKLNIDLSRREMEQILEAVQGDANTRAVELHLLEGGKEWPVPAGVTGAVAFRKPDGHKGLYDTLPDGTAAVTIQGNTVTAVLAPQVLSCAGDTAAAVVLTDAELNRLATFPITVHVAPDPSGGKSLSGDYYKYTTMEQVSAAVDAIRAAASEAACPIVCQAVGDSISVTDAACRPLRGLTLYGKTTQSGTPAPEAPVALTSVGAGGSIGVTVTGAAEAVQHLTAATPNGLPGVPIQTDASGVGKESYTDANGQRWVCDTIDFARGMYLQRVVAKVLNGTENWYNYGSGAFNHRLGALGTGVNHACLCDRLPFGNITGSSGIGIRTFNSEAHGYLMAYVRLPEAYQEVVTSIATFKEWLAKNPVTILYALAEPVETPLSAEELAQYAALHSHTQHTAVNNDAGAGMGISYVADTKTYIDNQFTALRNAILSAGANI